MNWVAHPSGRQVRTSGISCAGETEAGNTNWEEWGCTNCLTIVVDTSVCQFTATPTYASGIAGDSSHWDTKGSSEIYQETASSFRLFIQTSGVSALQANSWKWRVNW